jgi:hypothetical protein
MNRRRRGERGPGNIAEFLPRYRFPANGIEPDEHFADSRIQRQPLQIRTGTDLSGCRRRNVDDRRRIQSMQASQSPSLVQLTRGEEILILPERWRGTLFESDTTFSASPLSIARCNEKYSGYRTGLENGCAAGDRRVKPIR